VLDFIDPSLVGQAIVVVLWLVAMVVLWVIFNRHSPPFLKVKFKHALWRQTTNGALYQAYLSSRVMAINSDAAELFGLDAYTAKGKRLEQLPTVSYALERAFPESQRNDVIQLGSEAAIVIPGKNAMRMVPDWHWRRGHVVGLSLTIQQTEQSIADELLRH